MANFTVTTLSDVTDATDGETTLREAVDAANSAAGADDIVFASGLSGQLTLTRGAIRINDDLTIDGDVDGDGTLDITINGSGARSLSITTYSGDPNVVALNGLGFTNTGAGSGAPRAGGGVYAFDAELTITNAQFDRNYAIERGGAVYGLSSNVTIRDSLFLDNETSRSYGGEGGAVNVQGGSLVIENSDIVSGASYAGGGVFAGGASSVSISGGTIADNTVGFSGGGVQLRNVASASISGVRFSGNYDSSGFGEGGAIHLTDGSLDIDNAEFLINYVGDKGGALFIGSGASDDTVTLTNSSISRSSADTGGAIYVTGNNLTISGVEIINNDADENGAGLFVNSGDVLISNSLIDGNDAKGVGGGFYVDNGALTLNNITLTDNSAEDGGGGLALNGNLSVNNSTLTGNTAYFAGGLNNRFADVEISNTIILGNGSSAAYSTEVDFNGSPDFFGLNIIGADAAAYDASGEANVENAAADSVFATTATVNGVLAGVLADNGGPVETVALKADQFNIALDASGGSSIQTSDARGTAAFNQVGLGAETGDGVRDLGAFELESQVTVTPPETPSLIVTIAGDIVDAFDNETSLREAIAFANSDADQSDITFDAGLKGATLLLTQGQLDVNSPVSIDGDNDGDGDRDITLDGDDAQTIIQVFDQDENFNPIDASVAVNGLILQNGNGGGSYAGAINSGTSGVAITNSRFEGNSGGAYGGAVNFSGDFSAQVNALTIQDSEFLNNMNVLQGPNSAGAVGSQDGIILVENSSFTGNVAAGGAGAIGAGFLGKITVRDSVFTNNEAQTLGGGAINDGTSNPLTVERSTFIGNSAISHGGAIGVYGAGSVISDSTFLNNTSANKGGAMYGLGGDLSLTNVTAAENGAQYGGAIGFSGAGPLNITNSTLTANESYFGGGAIYDGGASGTISDSIILGNVGDTFISATYNAISDGSGFTFSGLNLIGVDGAAFDAAAAGASVENAAVADVFETTAAFFAGFTGGVAADNGGPVQTVALKLDAANPAIDTSGGAAIPASDARGEAAVDQPGVGADTGDGIRDLGAFELTDPLAQTIIGTGGDDTIEGTPFVDVIDAGDGNDTIDAKRGGDTIFGGAGEDLIDAGPGVDEVYGGADNDEIYGGAGRDLQLFGGDGDDIVYGRGGGDSLHGDAGNDQLFGGISNDKIFGGTDDDTLLGGEGNDDLFGGDGVDDLSGGAGNDDLFGGDGDDVLAGNDGTDRIFGGAGNDTATGGEGNDTLEGGDGADSLAGGIGDDVLFGGAQFDTLEGNDGQDTIYGGAGKDNLAGGAGDDLIFGGSGKDVILGGADADVIHGDGGRDDITGGIGDDMLFGGAENDQISGGDGADTLRGGAGDDHLTGGADADVFLFEDGFGADQITDFQQGADLIDLAGVTTAASFADLTITASGASVEIAIAGVTDVITANGAVADYDATDFAF